MILRLDELLNELKKMKKNHGNIEVELITFEGDIPIDKVTVVNIEGKKILRIEAVV